MLDGEMASQDPAGIGEQDLVGLSVVVRSGRRNQPSPNALCEFSSYRNATTSSSREKRESGAIFTLTIQSGDRRG